MAYDPDLAARTREALADAGNLREVQMFGGLAFMVDDSMVVCVSTGGGALLVRVSPGRDGEYLAQPGARRAQMGAGRSMGEGWIAVDDEAVQTEAGLQFWVRAAVAHRTQ
ncbi:TfoX/Sxy family protein [Nocardioides zeae]